MTPSTAANLLRAQLIDAFDRVQWLVEDLSDDEWAWEPVTPCWSVRPRDVAGPGWGIGDWVFGEAKLRITDVEVHGGAVASVASRERPPRRPHPPRRGDRPAPGHPLRTRPRPTATRAVGPDRRGSDRPP